MVFRKYQWKIQIRTNKDAPWKDDGLPPKSVEMPNYKTHDMETVPNSFRLDLADGEPAPEEFYAIRGARPIMTHEVRTVLESVDAGGNRVTHEIRFFEKVDPRKKLIPDEGIAYLTCLIDNCGAHVLPGTQTRHLIESHNKRFKYIKDVDQTYQKFFEVHLLHGKTVAEARNLDEPKQMS